MYASEPNNSANHWWQFTFDGTTGIEILDNGRTVRLHFVNGQRGDADLAANGTIDGLAEKTFTGIKSLRVETASGNDTLEVTGRAKLATILDGGDGDDRLFGDSGADRLR